MAGCNGGEADTTDCRKSPVADGSAGATRILAGISGTGNQWWELNILFCFAVVMQVVCFWQRPDAIKGAITGTMLALYLPFSTASYGWQGLVMLLAAVSVWQVPEQYRGRLFYCGCALLCG